MFILADGIFVVGFYFLFKTDQFILKRGAVRGHQFQVNGFNVTHGVNGFIGKRNTTVFKTAHHMQQRLDVFDMAQQLGTTAFARG